MQYSSESWYWPATQYQWNLSCPSISVYKLFERPSYSSLIRLLYYWQCAILMHLILLLQEFLAGTSYMADITGIKGQNNQELHLQSLWSFLQVGVFIVCQVFSGFLKLHFCKSFILICRYILSGTQTVRWSDFL